MKKLPPCSYPTIFLAIPMIAGGALLPLEAGNTASPSPLWIGGIRVELASTPKEEQPDLDWQMVSVMLSDNVGLRQLYVENLRKQPKFLGHGMEFVSKLLVFAAESLTPAERRERFIDGLLSAHREVLSKVEAETTLSKPIRAQAQRTREYYIDSGTMAEELAAYAEIITLTEEASKSGKASAPPKKAASAEFKLTAILKELRSLRGDELAARAPALRKRAVRIVNAGIGPGYSGFGKPYWPWKPDPRRITTNDEYDVYVVRAAFATSTLDAESRASFKEAIEKRWTGRLPSGSDPGLMRVEVTVRALKADGSREKSELRIGRRSKTKAVRDGILLAPGAGPVVIAHEFGHLLGLQDEYGEVYDPKDRVHRVTYRTDSLMGSLTGQVLPRHRAEAKRILDEVSTAHTGE